MAEDALLLTSLSARLEEVFLDTQPRIKPDETSEDDTQGGRCSSSSSLPNESSINNLPDEVLSLIFSYVGVEDLVTSVQRVCWNWNRLCLNSDMWSRIVYSPSHYVTEKTLLHLLRQMPFLQNLIYTSGRSLLSLYIITENCPLLKTLAVSDNQQIDTDFVIHLRERCPFLETLTLPVEVLYNQQQCFNVGGMVNLKFLTFRADHSKFWGQPAAYLGLLACRCPSLVSIDLREVVLQREDVHYFFQLKQTQLKRLLINCKTVTDCVVPILSTCKVLRELHVVCECTSMMQVPKTNIWQFRRIRGGLCKGFPAFVDETLTSLTLNSMRWMEFRFLRNFFMESALGQLTQLSIYDYFHYKDLLAGVIVRYCISLRLLHLDYCHTLSDETAIALPNLLHLESVSLEGARITNDGVVHLTGCRNLKYLSIAKCMYVGSDGVQKVMRLPELRTLKLDYCNLEGLCFTNIPKYLKNLTYLSIVNCMFVNFRDLGKFMADNPLRIVEQTKASYYKNCKYEVVVTDDTDDEIDDI